MYWPPMTIRTVDCRNFGRDVLVGTATISSFAKYIWMSPEERWQKQQEKALKQNGGSKSIIAGGKFFL